MYICVFHVRKKEKERVREKVNIANKKYIIKKNPIKIYTIYIEFWKWHHFFFFVRSFVHSLIISWHQYIIIGGYTHPYSLLLLLLDAALLLVLAPLLSSNGFHHFIDIYNTFYGYFVSNLIHSLSLFSLLLKKRKNKFLDSYI